MTDVNLTTKTLKVTFKNDILGIHARPADATVKFCTYLDSLVYLCKRNEIDLGPGRKGLTSPNASYQVANGRDVMEVLLLTIRHGSDFYIVVRHLDAATASDDARQLQEFFEEGKPNKPNWANGRAWPPEFMMGGSRVEEVETPELLLEALPKVSADDPVAKMWLDPEARPPWM